jgi:hypothetical protein
MRVRRWLEEARVCLGTVAAVAVLLSCQRDRPVFDPEQATLTNGALLISLLSSQDDAVVLLYDPSDCFTCGQYLSSFLAPGSSSVAILVLTREPTAVERHLLAMYRIRVAGVLTHDAVVPSVTPVAYLWRGQQLDAVSTPAALQWLHQRGGQTQDKTPSGGRTAEMPAQQAVQTATAPL